MTTPNPTQQRDASGRARWLARAAAAVLFCYWVALVTSTHLPRVPEPFQFRPSDKLVHFLAYALLALLAALAWSLRWRLGWRAMLGLLALLAVHGSLDEVTQPAFGRHADVLDWCADVLGAALGLGLFAAVRQLRQSN